MSITNSFQRKYEPSSIEHTQEEIEYINSLPVVTLEEFFQMSDEELFVCTPLSAFSEEEEE